MLALFALALAGAAALSAALATPARAASSVRVNAGGAAVTTAAGAVFAADGSVSGGNVYRIAQPVSGTSDPALYQDERWGQFGYALPVENGTYDVRFHFVELYYGTAVAGGAGKRVFGMDVLDTPASPDLQGIDVYAQVGPRAALVKTVPNVTVGDGVLDIRSVYGAADDPELAAVEVVPASAPPPDTTAPVVSLTAPVGGGQVSGTVAVAASASDDRAVAGVGFRLDGASLGAEDTTAPYTVSWDTSATVDGAHTLTAVARDAAGNQTTSPPVTVTVANAAPPPPGGAPVAAYGFEEGAGTTVVDSSGNRHTGTLSHATRTAAGRFGSALAFNGVDSWVTVPDAPGLDPVRALTVEAWVYPTVAAGASWRTVVLKETAGSLAAALYASTDTARPSGHVYSGGDLDARGPAPLPANTWTHLALTWDGQTLRLYVNGSLAASRPAAGTLPSSTGPLRFGGNAVWGEWFEGRLDEIRIYDRTLAASAIAADMNAPVVAAGTPDTSPPSAPAGLTASPARTSVALAWSPSSDDVGVTRYDVFRDGALAGSTAATSFTVDGLACASEATLGVEARDAAGNVSARTTLVATTAACAPPPLNTGDAFKRVVVGPGLVDASVRVVVRTADDRVVIFAADDTAQKRGTGPGVIRAWKADRQGIPTGFAEVDGAARPSAAGTAVLGSPDVRLDAYGVAHLVYVDKGRAELVYRTFSTLTDRWGPPEVLATGVTVGTHPFRRAETANTLVLDGAEAPHVVYTAGSDVLYRNRAGGSWSEPQLVARGTQPIDPQLAAGADGDLHLAWLEQGASPCIVYARRSGGVWGAPETVAGTDVLGDGNLDQGPSVVVTRAGVPYVGYVSALPGSFVRVAYRTPVGWALDSPPDLYAHTPQIYSRDDDVYAFLGHDSLIRFGYTYRQSGRPWAAYSPLTTVADGQLDGGASIRWDPAREPNPGVIDAAFFDEDTRGDRTWIPELYYTAVLPAAPAPLAVSLSSPAAGATVSGTVTVAADTAGGTGIAGVQFRLDGAVLGAEDTSAPYALAWDTGPAAPGPHTLTAVARDGSGATATSTPVTVSVQAAPPPPAAGLVAAYGFGEATGTTVSDASGNGNSGTINGATRTSAGKYGAALSFSGTGNWVTVPDAPTLDLTTRMTLEAWVYPTALSSWRTILIKEQTAQLAYALYANTDTNRPSANAYTTGDLDTRGTAQLPLNTWTHLAATWDGQTLRLYVNGTLASSRPLTGSIGNSSGPLRFGGNGVWGEWFGGRLDEIRLYNRALSATEITTDMNTELNNKI